MASPYILGKEGKTIKNYPTGFPMFFKERQPRIVAADPWSFFANLAHDTLDKKNALKASSFIDQGYDLYEAARNPNFGSRPLLYYYAFLNLVKASLIINKITIPNSVKHGIYDPKTNNKEKLYFQKQSIKIEKETPKKSEIMAQFIKLLGQDTTKDTEHSILDMLYQIPSIHKSFLNITKRKPIFIPISKLEILNNSGQLWTRMYLNKNDETTKNLLKQFIDKDKKYKLFQRVSVPSIDKDFYIFDSKEMTTGPKWRDSGLMKLSKEFETFGIGSILTDHGFRFYISIIDQKKLFPQLGAIYSVFFYLGSIARYRPFDFNKIIEGKYSWLIDEFLATQPLQFVYLLLSHTAGVDVVRPYSAIN